jgi:thioredoxin reductase (NADPH)
VTTPIILVVESDPDALTSIAEALRRRFGADYEVWTDASPTSALARLADACGRREPVALVIAGVSTRDTDGLDWLGRVRDLCPWASRCALVSWGDGETYPVLREALMRGLRTLVLERLVPGGQAGTSSMIRNYLGFSRGISGAELAARAHEQAVSLGAEFLLTSDVTGVTSDESEHVITTIDGLDRLLGKGVFYGAATAEAPAQAGRDVFVVGAGNSAGQAAVHLARYAASVRLLVRGDALTMSDSWCGRSSAPAMSASG